MALIIFLRKLEIVIAIVILEILINSCLAIRAFTYSGLEFIDLV